MTPADRLTMLDLLTDRMQAHLRDMTATMHTDPAAWAAAKAACNECLAIADALPPCDPR